MEDPRHGEEKFLVSLFPTGTCGGRVLENVPPVPQRAVAGPDSGQHRQASSCLLISLLMQLNYTALVLSVVHGITILVPEQLVNDLKYLRHLIDI